MKFTAAGDAIIARRIPESFPGYEELVPFLAEGDARFFNLETTIHREGECCAAALSGGTYLRTDPEVLDDLKRFGFNMTSFNNNHALDYSYGGLLQTLDYVAESGLVGAGVGRNMAEAAAPRYLDTPNGRVALIALNTTFHPSMMAGVQTERVPGRPGINGIRFSHTSYVTPEDFTYIRKLALRTNINAEREILKGEGYLAASAEDVCEYGEEVFRIGEPVGVRSTLNAVDMARLQKSIHEAKLAADYIIVSVHSHELSGTEKETPSDFLVELSHAAIDMGANAVIGHGPHLLRPIEVYKNSPIFYSLGDFILELYNVEFAPNEMYEKQGLAHNETVHTLLKTRSRGFTIGLMENRKMFESVIPYWETDADGKLTSLSLLPIMLTMKGKKSEIGLPRWDKNPTFAARLADISAPYGVAVTLGEDGLLHCAW